MTDFTLIGDGFTEFQGKICHKYKVIARTGTKTDEIAKQEIYQKGAVWIKVSPVEWYVVTGWRGSPLFSGAVYLVVTDEHMNLTAKEKIVEKGGLQATEQFLSMSVEDRIKRDMEE